MRRYLSCPTQGRIFLKKMPLHFVNIRLAKLTFFFLFIPQNCSPDRKDSDALDTVPAHFDTIQPTI